MPPISFTLTSATNYISLTEIFEDFFDKESKRNMFKKVKEESGPNIKEPNIHL